MRFCSIVISFIALIVMSESARGECYIEKSPIVLYLVNDGSVVELANNVFFKKKYDVRSIKFPFFAGIIVQNEDCGISNIDIGVITDKDISQDVTWINRRNGVVEYVEEVPGHLMMRGTSRQNPRFIDALTKALAYRGYTVARITYGEPPDPNWRPDIPDAKPFVPFLEGRR